MMKLTPYVQEESPLNFSAIPCGLTISADIFVGTVEKNSTRWGGNINERFSRRLLIGRALGICNGEPVIIGSRISVANIIETSKLLGWDEGRLTQEYPHLSLDEIRACFDYYEDNKSEIDALIESEDQQF